MAQCATLIAPYGPTSLSEQSRAAAQPSGAVAISESNVAATACGGGAVIGLIIGAAVVGTNKVAVGVAPMVFKLAPQQPHPHPTLFRDPKRGPQFPPALHCRDP